MQEIGPVEPPDPTTAGTLASFVRCLHDLRRWAGEPSLRRLRQLGGTVRLSSGDVVDALPQSTVSHVLRGGRLPKLDFVEAFVRACLSARQEPEAAIAAAVARWQRAWRQVAPSPREPANAAADSAPVRRYRQLPPDIAEFTGREAQVRALMELTDPGPDQPETLRVAHIDGMAGVGKTRLAVHAGHALARSGRYEMFLYLDLRGFAGDRPPAEPAALLDGVLRLVGVPAEEIPADVSGRAALYRDRLHDSRALVLLDDAVSEAQVAPLLPACPTCLVIVTSRRTLALDGALPIRLEPFNTAESIDLLARLTDPARVAADPAGAAEVAARCGNLPLAVALAARRLQARPAWSVGDLARRLGDAGRLDELSVGGRAVGSAFSLSYRALAPEQARLFRLLALHPGGTVTAGATAALAAVPRRRAATLLESLVDDHLLQEPAPGRYAFHDLLREYAHARLEAEQSPMDRDAALHRVLAWYLNSTEAADRLLEPRRRKPKPDADLVVGEIDMVPEFDSREGALDWLRAEHTTLTAAVSVAAAAGLNSIARRLAAALWSYLYLVKHWDDWVATHRIGLAAAEREGDREAQSRILNQLGVAHWQRRDHEAAVDCYLRALEISRSIDDLDGESIVLDNLGTAYDDLGRHERAVECYRRSLDLAERLGRPAGQASVLNNLGEVYRRLRRFGEAGECLTRALAIQRELGDSYLRFTLCSLGELHDDLGEPRLAEDFYQHSREEAERAGDGWLTAVLWDKLANTASTSGDLPTARKRWAAAAAAYTAIGDLHEAARLRGLAEPSP